MTYIPLGFYSEPPVGAQTWDELHIPPCAGTNKERDEPKRNETTSNLMQRCSNVWKLLGHTINFAAVSSFKYGV